MKVEHAYKVEKLCEVGSLIKHKSLIEGVTVVWALPFVIFMGGLIRDHLRHEIGITICIPNPDIGAKYWDQTQEVGG